MRNEKGGRPISENLDFRIMPSCYSLLAFLGDLGACPAQDTKCRGENYLRASFFGDIPVVIEWDEEGNISGSIDFRGVNGVSMKDVIRKFAKIGVVVAVEDTGMFRVGHFQLEIKHLSKPVSFLEKEAEQAEKARQKKAEITRRQINIAYSLIPPHC